jgi:hypothetical protein
MCMPQGRTVSLLDMGRWLLCCLTLCCRGAPNLWYQSRALQVNPPPPPTPCPAPPPTPPHHYLCPADVGDKILSASSAVLYGFCHTAVSSLHLLSCSIPYAVVLPYAASCHLSPESWRCWGSAFPPPCPWAPSHLLTRTPVCICITARQAGELSVNSADQCHTCAHIQARRLDTLSVDSADQCHACDIGLAGR